MATYFISDLHLGASYIADHRAHEQRVVRWLRSIAPTADRLFLLGDILDYWFEYKTVVPRGYTRFFGAIAELVDNGVEVTWFKGNHDIWIFGYLQEELGVRVVDGSLVTELDGRRFFMEHGDGVGRIGTGFKLIRSVFRNRVCQKLYAAIHPRWTIPLAHGWSQSSRKGHSKKKAYTPGSYDPRHDSLVDFAREYMAQHGHIDYFIFGHKHLLVDVSVTDDTRLIILGDWIKRFTYAVWDGSSLSLHKSDV